MLSFIRDLFEAIGLALTFNLEAINRYAMERQSGLMLVLAILCGASLLLGQSVILFLNRVPPRRFGLSLLVGGLNFAINLIGWALVTWLAGLLLFDENVTVQKVLRLVALSSAPLIFGFLVLIPYAGMFIGRLLSVWSLLIMVEFVAAIYHSGFWAALLCVTLGWLLMQFFSATVGRPLIRLRDWFWHKVIGERRITSLDRIVDALNQDDPLTPYIREKQQ